MKLSFVPFICTFIVGSIFLATAIIKANDAKQFIRHNLRYGLGNPRLVKLASIAFISIESALGLALILQIYLQWSILIAVLLLLCFSVLTRWSTASGRTFNCGCYGGIVLVTPLQSILLNFVYISLLLFALFEQNPDRTIQSWQVVLTTIVAIISGISAVRSRNQPLFDFSRLKVGNSWKSSWLKSSEFNLQQGDYFLAFLSPSCHYCHQWIESLNQANSQTQKLQILGILPVETEQIAEFQASHQVRFPLATMNPILFSYMLDGVPTGVILKDGTIIRRWNGNLPLELLQAENKLAS